MPSSNSAEVLISAFCAERQAPDHPSRRFGSPGLRVSGISDGTDGVQWNAWIEWTEHEQMAFAGVNLEGKKYDGWPVGRLIRRELLRPALFDAINAVRRPELVQAVWYRDAWQATSRPSIKEKRIGGSPLLLHTVTPDGWRAMLEEARDCLGPGDAGRARQVVTVRDERKEFEVSPHLQFRRAFWPHDASSTHSWRIALASVFADLHPLFEFTKSRASLRAP